MEYKVIDIDPGMTYEPGEEVLGTVEADSAPQAVAKVLRSIGVDLLAAWDPAGYEKHIRAHTKAIPTHRAPDCECGACCGWRLAMAGSMLYCVEPSHGLNCPCVPTRY